AVSPAAGLGLAGSYLVQFPSLDRVRWRCCDPFGWSQDGSTALLSNPDMIADQSQLIAYDVAADRFRTLFTSRYQTTPLGLSPDGRWVVYREFDDLPGTPPSRQPPGELLAISTDGSQTRAFYSIYGTDPLEESVLGWLSDSAFLLQHQDEPCADVPHVLELSLAQLDDGHARHIYDSHSYAALDPRSGTVLLEQVTPGRCPEPGERGPLVLLAPADGWVPHPLLPGEGWGERWEVRRIEWHPELNLFSVRVGGNDGGPLREVMTLTLDGQLVHSFPLYGAEFMTSANLFPSPDGKWIVVGGTSPHGTRLYDAGGGLVRELVMEGGELSQGVQRVLWLPGEAAFLMSAADGAGIFRAAAEQGWMPELIEPFAGYATELTLVEAPARPFSQACGGRNYTRLDVGDRIMVSYEPPLSSRLRSNPGLAAGVVDMLEPGQQAGVMGGPVCADGYVWWELQPINTNLRGWAAEGDADGAWLVPVGTSGRSGAVATPAPAGPTSTPVPAGPSPTALPIAPLSPRGPWVIGVRYPAPAPDPGEIRALNAGGTGLTRLPDYWFPHAAADLRDGASEKHALIGLRNLTCVGPLCDYVLRVFGLPNLEQVFSIRMLNLDLARKAGQGPWSEALAANPPLMAVGWEGREPALLWSPDGRYLAFVGAIDGPSADVYAYDSLTSAVLRLTDGPGQPVLMGWSPDSRRVVHMEVEFEYGASGPGFEPVAVWAADVQGGPATYLYASRGDLGDSEEIVGWRSDHEVVTAERDPLGRTGRLAQVDVLTGTFRTLYAGEVSSAAVDPSSGTVAFVPYDPIFFPLQADPSLGGPIAAAWADAAGTLTEGGIYLLRPGSDVPMRLAYEEWYAAYEGLAWIPEAQRFFAAWSVALSFTADGQVDQVFNERHIPVASPDGKWLVFRRPPHFPAIAVFAAAGDLAFEFEGMHATDILWKRDSAGVYLYSPEAGLRFFSPSRHTYEML
ncbi:MAG TPA: hypothetical protein VGA07_05840, partial [Anaerolineales bacterium]